MRTIDIDEQVLANSIDILNNHVLMNSPMDADVPNPNPDLYNSPGMTKTASQIINIERPDCHNMDAQKPPLGSKADSKSEIGLKQSQNGSNVDMENKSVKNQAPKGM